METAILVFILFAELLIAGIFVNVNTGQADKGAGIYDAWNSKIEYVSTYTTNTFQRYNGLTLDYFEVCSLVNSTYESDECSAEYPAVDFITNSDMYIKKKFLCNVEVQNYGIYEIKITFKEVVE